MYISTNEKFDLLMRGEDTFRMISGNVELWTLD
jgi:hypothetical protein